MNPVVPIIVGSLIGMLISLGLLTVYVAGHGAGVKASEERHANDK